MQTVSTAALAGLLYSGRTEVRVGDDTENLLRTLCDMIGMRKKGAAECEQVRVALLELAVRGRILIEFEPGDGPRIVAIKRPVPDNSAAEIERLNGEVSRLNGVNHDLEVKIAADAETVGTAEELIALAETAKGEAVAALEQFKRQAAEQLAEREKDQEAKQRRISSLETAARKDTETIDRLNGEVEELNRQVGTLKDRLALFEVKPISAHVSAETGERVQIGCGCVIARTSTEECRVPREPSEPVHPFVAIAVTRHSDADGLLGALRGFGAHENLDD